MNMQQRLAAALVLTLAALETPGDLTAEERDHVIEDGGALLAELQAADEVPHAIKGPTRFPRSDTEYVVHAGHCPFCGSEDIEGDGVDVDGDGATQEVSCSSCEASWYDTYQLTGYRTINVPNAEPEETTNG